MESALKGVRILDLTRALRLHAAARGREPSPSSIVSWAGVALVASISAGRGCPMLHPSPDRGNSCDGVVTSGHPSS
jgi:hypothetical protein